MYSATVTSKGQLVIPIGLRKKYGIKSGTKINFIEDADGIRINPLTAEKISGNIGFLKSDIKLLKALRKEKKAEQAR